MEKKQIGVIMMAAAGVTAVVALGLLLKWYPIHVSVIALAAVVGFVGNKFYREG